MSDTYADVDASADPEMAVTWQERMNTRPAVRAYKRHSHDLLAAARRILDVGCGPGADAAALGTDRCVGVDPSARMARTAAARGVVLARADARRLPFPDGTFGGVRADRVLQHVADPDRALGEMARVTAAGGRVVVADADQETLVIRVPGVRPRVLRRLKELRRDVGYRNGALISGVPERLGRLGLRDVAVAAFPLTITDPAEAFGLPTWPAAWRTAAPFDEDELAEWDAAIRDRSRPGFLYVVTFLVVSGTRP